MAYDHSPVPFEFRKSDSDDEPRPLDLSEGSNARAVLERLAAHSETGFTPEEMSEQTGLSRENVETALCRLKARDLVLAREADWTIGEDDRPLAYSAMILGTEAASDRFGDKDWGDWRETAVDPRRVDPNDGTRDGQS